MLEKVLAKIEARKEEILEFAGKMISFATVDPPAHNTRDIQLWLASEEEKIGMKTKMIDLYPGEPLLVGTAAGDPGEKTLIFNGHVDVVPAPEEWDFNPFAAWWDNTYLYGRGAADMKGGLTAAFWAIRTVLESGIKLNNTVMLQTVIGEEMGELGTKLLLEKGYTGDFAVVPEPTELGINGQGGVVTVWVIIRSPESFHDAMRARMIHAGGGVEGAGAIEKMCKIIQGMQELERHWAVTKSYHGLAPGANTINPAVIKGGRTPAHVADECSLWYTIHFLPDEKLEEVTEEIVSYLNNLFNADPWLKKNRPELVIGGTSMLRDRGETFPASEVLKDNPEVQLLFSVFRKVLGREAESIIWPSVSDSGWFAEAGVPVVICGPGRLEEAHSTNEKIEIQGLLEAVKLYAGLIIEFCAR